MEKQIWMKKRRGMTLLELLGVMAVIAIISVISVGGITAARDSANETSVSSDIRTYQMAVQQVLVQHPEVMKYIATKPTNAVEQFTQMLNSQMESSWQFDVLSGNTDSGGIGGSSIKRDAWGNPYGLYIYFDDKAPTYTDKTGTALKDSDSCVYIVICSAGKNSTGGPMGADGNNFDAGTRKIISAAEMVNNTDGVDDIGVIVRILNGDVYAATFGVDKATLGKLDDMNWIFGVPSATGGKCYDFANVADKTAITGGSLDVYYDSLTLASITGGVVGTWS